MESSSPAEKGGLRKARKPGALLLLALRLSHAEPQFPHLYNSSWSQKMNQTESGKGNGRTWYWIPTGLARPELAGSPDTEGQMGGVLAGGQEVRWRTWNRSIAHRE